MCLDDELRKPAAELNLPFVLHMPFCLRMIYQESMIIRIQQ